MQYDELIKLLKSMDPAECYPLYVPSVMRPAHFLYQNVIQFLPREYKDKVYYITRDKYYKDYKRTQPDVNVVVIPKEYEYDGYGLDTTRKFIFDLAVAQGHKRIFDWDDDIDSLGAIYSAEETSRKLRKADCQEYAMQLLTLASHVASDAFSRYPRLCLGQLGRITPSSCEKDYHKTKLVVNKGGIPRMSNIVNVQRMKKHGMERTGEWDKQSEDMGTTFMVLENGGQCFTIPTIVHTVPPIENNPRTEPILHGDEKNLWKEAEEKILSHPVGQYVTYTSANMKYFGRKRPVGVNWNRWNADHNIKSVVEEW